MKTRRVQILILAAAVAGLFGGLAPQAHGQLPTSAELVPADAAFYSSTLRLREQYDAFVGSKAFEKLWQMPIVQLGWMAFQAQWNDPDGDMAQFKAMIEQPENKQLVELLTDGISREVFVFGDENYAELLALANELNSANRSAQLATLGAGGPEANEILAQKILEALNKRLETWRIPDTVIGFRLSDTQPALAQMARLEQIAGFLLAQQPDLQDRFSRQQIGGGEFLTLLLDGSLVPWEELPPDAERFLEPLRPKLEQMTLAISLGVRDDFLIISLGDSNEHLEKLGQGPGLMSTPEMAPLKQHASKPVTSIGYVSKNFMESANAADQQLDQLVQMGEALLPMAQLEPGLENEVKQDVGKLVDDLKSAIPEVGAQSGIGFRTPQGFEGYSYYWGNYPHLDGSKPLSILEHVGGSPLFVYAARGVQSPEALAKVNYWLGRALYYAEEIGAARLEGEEREFYDKVKDDIRPLLAQITTITREKLVPAFKDGESALVMDADTTSERWHASMPPTETPLPMLELAAVYRVSDAQLLKEAAAEYFSVAQKVMDILHKASPEEIPEIKVPGPESREFADATIYYYRLPAEAQTDKQLAPNAGLSSDTLVLSMIPKMTLRLINRSDFTIPAAKPNQPLATAFAMDFAGLLDAAAPWIEYAMGLSGDVNDSIRSQVFAGLSVAKCFRGFSGVTYREGDAWVTRSQMYFEDLE